MSKAATLRELSSRKVNGNGLRIGICHTQWNKEIVGSLVSGCEQELKAQGVSEVIVVAVPGSYELPYGASQMISAYNLDGVVCIGCLIKGDTMHFEYISEAVTQGIMRINLDTGAPVLFGVLTCMTEEQARLRAGLESTGHNHGVEWAQSVVEMAQLKQRTTTNKGIKISINQEINSLLLYTGAVAAVGVAILATFSLMKH